MDLERLISGGEQRLLAAGHRRFDLTGDFVLGFWDPQSDVHHHQRFEGGAFVEWRLGQPSTPQALTFALTGVDLVAILSSQVTGTSALETLRVVTSVDGAADLPPPLDAVTYEAFQRVPTIPDVRSTIALHFADAPFGPADVTILIEEGRPRIVLGSATDPDAEAQLSFPLILSYLAGDLGFMDMLTGGKIVGDWAQLMLVAGVVESEEFQHALDPVRGAYRHLLTAVEIMGTGWYRQALAEAIEMQRAG